MDDDDFTISYVIDKIPNSPPSHQLPTESKKKMWIVDINGEERTIAQGTLKELNRHQNPRVKSKLNISIWRSKSYHRVYLEYIRSIFDQVRPIASYLEVHIPEKPLAPKNIGEGLKGPQIQFWKEDVFLKYDKKKMSSFIQLPYQSNTSLM